MPSNPFRSLGAAYYLRHLFFGTILALALGGIWSHNHAITQSGYLYFIVSTLLYPFARFVYEAIARFFLGNNEIYLPLLIGLNLKFVSMGVCLLLAIAIAPFGLVYLALRKNYSHSNL